LKLIEPEIFCLWLIAQKRVNNAARKLDHLRS